MHRTVMPGFCLLLVCLVCACTPYTKTLEQSVERADETAAMSALRTAAVAQRTYSVSNEGTFGSFEQLVKGGFLDSRYNSDKPKFKGYVLTMTVTNNSDGGSYALNADPEPPQQGRHFFMDSTSGLIHSNGERPAGAADPTLDQ